MGRPSPDLIVAWAPDDGPFTTPWTWSDISTRVRSITTSRGRTSELDTFKVGEASVTVDNRDRFFDPTYAAGANYGKLARGIPVRIGVGIAARTDLANPITYLPFTERSGVPRDLRCLQDGAFTGSTYSWAAQGPQQGTGGALALNTSAADTYITQAAQAAFTSSPNVLTVSAWVCLFGTATTGAVMSLGYTNGLGLTISNTGVVRAFVASTGTTIAQTSGTPCATQDSSTWYHVVYTKNGTGASASAIWVNGVSQSLSTNAAVTLSPGTQALRWGVGLASAGPTFTNYFRGRLSHCALYGRVLTSTEIANLSFSRLSPTGFIFTGYTDELPQSFPGPDSTAQLRLVDALGVLKARSYHDNDPYGAAVLADSPWAWWRMREASWPTGAGSMQVYDHSGNRRHARHNSPSIRVGDEPLATDSPSVFYPRNTGIGMQTEWSESVTSLPLDPPMTLECWLQFDEIPKGKAWFLREGGHFPQESTIWRIQKWANVRYGLMVYFETWSWGEPPVASNSLQTELVIWGSYNPQVGDASDGTVSYLTRVPVTPYNIVQQTDLPLFDGQPHHLVIVIHNNWPSTAVPYPTVYIDGQNLPAAWVGVPPQYPMHDDAGMLTTLQLGDWLGGRLSEAAIYTTELSAARALAHYNAAERASWRDDTVDEAIAHLLTGTGWPTGLQDLETSPTKVSPVDVTSSSVADLVVATAEADGGILYVDAAGRIAFRSRRAYGTGGSLSTAAATLTDNRTEVTTESIFGYLASGFSYGLDRSLLRNYVTTSGVDSTLESYTASDASSIDTHGAARERKTLRAARRSDLMGWASARVQRYKNPTLLFEAMTIRPDDRPANLRPSGWQKLLELDLGTLVTAKRTPKTGAVVSQAGRVDAIEHHITPNVWEVTVRLSGRATSESLWVLGTGALGSSTPVTW